MLNLISGIIIGILLSLVAILVGKKAKNITKENEEELEPYRQVKGQRPAQIIKMEDNIKRILQDE